MANLLCEAKKELGAELRGQAKATAQKVCDVVKALVGGESGARKWLKQDGASPPQTFGRDPMSVAEEAKKDWESYWLA